MTPLCSPQVLLARALAASGALPRARPIQKTLRQRTARSARGEASHRAIPDRAAGRSRVRAHDDPPQPKPQQRGAPQKNTKTE